MQITPADRKSYEPVRSLLACRPGLASTAAIFTVIVCSVPLAAQEFVPSKIPTEKMARLTKLLGEWDATGFRLVDGEWQETGTAFKEVRSELNGLNLVAEVRPSRGVEESFSTETFSYQQYLGGYVYTIIDNNYANLDVMIGDIENGDLILRSLGDISTFRPSAPYEGQEWIWRVIFYDVETNPSGWTWEYSADQGETWNFRFKGETSRIED